jgi:hypothetical protein
VRVDPGSDPGRDDYGLPPVDIEIPDDARDLDRDVLAYHRELRTLRRRLRIRKLVTPLTSHGMVIPLVAACLAVTLVAGTLTTVLASRQAPSGGRAAPRSTPSSSSPPATAAFQQLPNALVLVGRREVALNTLAPAVLAWVPRACACATVLRRLSQQATLAHVAIYFVGTDGAVAQLPQLAGAAGRGFGQVIDDTQNVVGVTYHPNGLTAILAHSDGDVDRGDVVRLTAGVQLEGMLRSLTAAPASASPPGPTDSARLPGTGLRAPRLGG